MTQIVVVALVAVLVAAIVLAARYLPVERSRTVSTTLEPGLYLLTSGSCDTCQHARSQLNRSGILYEELVWQQHPGRFEEMGIDAVPSVVEVTESGKGRWWRGGVPLRIRMKRR